MAAIGVAACGSSSKAAAPVTTTTAATTTTGHPAVGIATGKGIRLFLACMRNHHVNLPASGPGSAGAAGPSQFPAAIRNSPKFVVALPICRPLITRFGGVETTTTG
jgi:hypothetical protein